MPEDEDWIDPRWVVLYEELDRQGVWVGSRDHLRIGSIAIDGEVRLAALFEAIDPYLRQRP